MYFKNRINFCGGDLKKFLLLLRTTSVLALKWIKYPNLLKISSKITMMSFFL